MDSWDPQRDDFQSKDFNSYTRGPGRNLPVNRGDKKYTSKNVQLFVTGIPNEITEDGLFNLFSRAGTVARVKKMVSKKQNAQDTFGFVEMANAIDAEKAIREFNNFKINRFVLRVKVSYQEKDKRRLPMDEDMVLMGESSFQNDSDSDDMASGLMNPAVNAAVSPAVNGFGHMHEQPSTGSGRGRMLADLSSASTKRTPLLQTPNYPQASPRQMNLSVTVDKDNHRVPTTPVGRGSTNQSMNFDGMGRGQGRNPHNGPGYNDIGYEGGYSSYNSGGYDRNYDGYNDSAPSGNYKPKRGRNKGRGYGANYGRGQPFPQYQQPPMVYGLPMITPYPYGMMQAAAGQSLLQPAFNPLMTPMISATSLSASQQQPNITSTPKPTATSKEKHDESFVTNECSVCSKLGTQRCSRCKEPYCSIECQSKDWPQHKDLCKTISSEKNMNDDFSEQFDVSVGDELIPKVKELMEKAVGEKIEITKKPKPVKPRTGDSPDAGGDRAQREKGKVQKADRQKDGDKDAKEGRGPKKSQEKTRNDGCLNCGSLEHRRKDCKEPVGINQNCYNCNQVGHLSKECPSTMDKTCYNCDSMGHLSKDCPEKPETCHNCHKPGHFSRECPEKSEVCYNCHKPGHFSRECHEKSENKPKSQQAGQNKPVRNGNVPMENHKPKTPKTPSPEATKVQSQTKRSPVSPPRKKTLAAEVLPLDKELYVVVSEVVDPGYFWVQCVNETNTSKLGEIMNDMGQKFSSSTNSVSSVMVGEYYGGQYSVDQAWYRVRVIEVQGSKIKINFIDFGNQEVTTTEKLRELEPSMIDLPSQAILCSLEGIEPVSGKEWNIPAPQLMAHLSPNMAYNLTCKKQVDTSTCRVHEVIMMNDKGENIAKNLLSANLAKVKSEPGSYPAAKSTPSASTPPKQSGPPMVRDLPRVQSTLTIGQAMTVYITEAVSPNCFSVQVLDENIMKPFAEFTAQLNQHYNQDTDTSYSPVVVGELVAAKFSGDNEWYRGEITELSSKYARVVFLDYGNSEEVEFKRIRKAAPMCMSQPIQAVSCCLVELEMQDDFQWPPEVIEFYKSLVLQPLKSVVKSKKNEKVAFELYTMSDESIAVKITTMLSALITRVTSSLNKISPKLDIKKSTLPANGEKVEVVVTKVVSLGEFYIQLGDAENRLKYGKMWSELNELCVKAVPYEPQVGDFVAAQFTDGDVTLWYRAKIVDMVGDTNYQAFFIDYGNTDMLGKEAVARLNEEFSHLPYWAICCKLAGCEDRSSPKAVEELAKCVDTLSLAKAVDIVDGSPQVELFRPDGSSINQRILDLDTVISNSVSQTNTNLHDPEMPNLVSNSSANSPRVQIADSVVEPVTMQESVLPIDGSQVLGIIVFIEKLSIFFVHLLTGDISDKLKSLETVNTICESDSTIYEPSINEYVSAKFTADSTWYRAKVIGKSDAGIEVLFVDYGNADIVPASNIRKHCAELNTIPALAVKCCLAGCGNKDKPEDLEEFKAVLNHKVNIKASERIGEKYTVELFLLNDEATCVNTVLKLDASQTQTAPATPPKQSAEATPSEPQSSLPTIELEKFPLGTSVSAAPVLINSVNEFFVQSADEEKQSFLIQIFIKLQEIFLANAEGYKPCLGEFVGVLFHDGTEELPYRGLVTETLSNTEYQLYLIDYGNTIKAKNEVIRKLDSCLYTYPQLASKCRLHGCQIDTEQTKQEFMAASLNIEMDMTVKSSHNGVLVVDLICKDGKNIAEYLLSLVDMASADTELVDQLPKCITPPKEALPKKSASPTQGERKVVFAQTLTCSHPQSDSLMVVMTSVLRPNLFHCQVFQEDQSNLKELKILTDTMKLDCEHSLFLDTPKFEVGELCCAKFPEDGEWYRGVVLEVFPDDTAKVAYVDYGNQSEVPLNYLRPVRLEYTVLPLLAFQCSLHGVSPTGASWTQEASLQMLGYQDRPLQAKVIQVQSDTYELELQDMNGENIGEQLIKAGVASPTKPSASGNDDAKARQDELERQNKMLQQQVSDMQAMMAKMLKK